MIVCMVDHRNSASHIDTIVVVIDRLYGKRMDETTQVMRSKILFFRILNELFFLLSVSAIGVSAGLPEFFFSLRKIRDCKMEI